MNIYMRLAYMINKEAYKKLCTFDLDGCKYYATSKPRPKCKGSIQWSKIESFFCSCYNKDDMSQLDFDYLTFAEGFDNATKNRSQIDDESFSGTFEAFSSLNGENYYQ